MKRAVFLVAALAAMLVFAFSAAKPLVTKAQGTGPLFYGCADFEVDIYANTNYGGAVDGFCPKTGYDSNINGTGYGAVVIGSPGNWGAWQEDDDFSANSNPNNPDFGDTHNMHDNMSSMQAYINSEVASDNFCMIFYGNVSFVVNGLGQPKYKYILYHGDGYDDIYNVLDIGVTPITDNADSSILKEQAFDPGCQNGDFKQWVYPT